MMRFLFPVFLLCVLHSFGAARRQEHVVASLYDWYKNVKSNPDLKKANAKVIDSEFKNCEYGFLLRYFLRDSVSNIGTFVNDFKILKEKHTDYSVPAIFAMDEAGAILTNDSVWLYLFPCFEEDREAVRQMGGVSGFTAGSKRILLFIDVHSDNWKNNIQYVVAHEYYHSHWAAKNRGSKAAFSLAGYLVFEGKADAFAHYLYPAVKVAWVNALSADERKREWNRIKGRLKETDVNLHADVMFGTSGYRKWTGYTIAYEATRQYLKKHPRIMPPDWYKIKAEKILEAYVPGQGAGP